MQTKMMILYTMMVVGIFLLVPTLMAQQSNSATSQNEDRVLAMQNHMPEENSEAYSLLNQDIVLDFQNASLNEALNLIANEVGLKLMYQKALLPEEQNLTYNNKAMTVYDALWDILDGTGIQFAVSENRQLVLLKLRDAEAVIESELQETVTGQVVDFQTGEPLPGVNIIVQGTTTGTATNPEGQYELTVPSLNDTLIFTYIGYLQQEVPINGRQEINIELQSEAITGDEVVVVGYGQQRRRDITSSIASVSAEDIANEPVQQIAQSLQGRVSGVQIVQNTGNPGSDFMMRLRGVSSVNDRDTQPLFVVDGNPMASISDISPSQVEDIQVLKSASATAIYGARGANGVVLITTRSGRAGDTSFDVNYYTGISTPRTVPLVNARDYAMLYNEAETTAGNPPIFDNPDQFGEGTDWQDVAYRTARTHNLNMSISGGSENSTFYLSGGYETVEGVIRTTNYNRFNVRLNSQHQITDYLTIGENIGVSWAQFEGINPYTMGGLNDREIARDPTVPIRHEDGSWGQLPTGDNLEASLQRQEDADTPNERPVVNGSAFIELDFFENLSFRSQYNISYGNELSRSFSPEYFISTTDQNETSSVGMSQSFWNNWNLENTLTFQDNFGNHNLEALAGVTFEENWSENFSAEAENLPAGHDEFRGLRTLDLAEENESVGGGGGGFAMISYLGRINYNYDETYLATINYRIDGSSKFGPENRWGYFPSFSLGWRLSNESFLEDVDWIDNLLVRGGWGQIGNQEPLANYAYTSVVNPNLGYNFGRQFQPGHAPQGAGNPHIRWEAIEETNIGVSFTGFGNSINVDVDWYNKVTTDMLLEVPVVAFSGLQDPPFSNGGEVLNRGYEISVGFQRTTPGDFYYNINANMSYNRNELVELAGAVTEIPGGWISFVGDNFITRAAEGQPLGSFYGYVMDGLFQNQQEIDNHAVQPNAEPGDIRFVDLNGDGRISSDDQTYIGNPWPSHTFGLSANFAYRNFDMNIGFQGVYGNEIFAAWKWTLYGPNWFNYHENALGRWTGENTSNSMPRMHIDDPNDNLRPSTWYVEDGSYLRLNNLQIGYTLPEGLVNLRNLRIYAAATNVFTITSYEGADPELGTSDSVAFDAPLFVGVDSGHYAVPRTFTVGVNIGF